MGRPSLSVSFRSGQLISAKFTVQKPFRNNNFCSCGTGDQSLQESKRKQTILEGILYFLALLAFHFVRVCVCLCICFLTI